MQAHASYKPSTAPWISELPAHWVEKPLLAVTRERREPNTGMLESNLLSLSYGRIVRKDINTNEGLLPESFETYQIVYPGDVVFRFTDLQNDQRSLRSALSDERGIITSAYIVVEQKEVDHSFFNYLMRAYDVQKVFYSMGGGLRQSLKYEDLRRLPIPLPPMQEQAAIVVFLDRETQRISYLMDKKRSFVKLLDEKEKAIISHLVRCGLNRSVSMIDSGVSWRGLVPSHWAKARLKDHFRVQKRQGYPDQPVLSVYREFGVIEKSSRDDNINKTPDDLTKYQLVVTNDLVINKMKAWQGSMGIAPLGGITSPDYVVMTPTGDHDPRYMHHYLRARPMAWVYRLISNGIREDQWRLEPEQFRGLPVFLPPLPEQRAIAEQLDRELQRIRRLIARTETSIELLSERRSALITAAVTGKIDVRGLTNKNIKAAA